MKSRLKNIVILLFAAFTCLPLLLAVIYAALNATGLAGIDAHGFTLNTFITVLSSSNFYTSFGFSIYITLIVIIIAVALALWGTLTLKKDVLHGRISYLLYVPLAVPVIVAAFISFQSLGQSGLISRILYAFNLISDPSQFAGFVNDPLSIGIIFTQIIIASAFFVILFSTIYENENVDRLHSVSSSLGSNHKTTLIKVIIPVLIKKAIPSIILYAIFVFGSYEIPLLLGRQDPQMISVAIARKFQLYNLHDVPVAYAMALLYTIFVITCLIILFRKKKLIHDV